MTNQRDHGPSPGHEIRARAHSPERRQTGYLEADLGSIAVAAAALVAAQLPGGEPVSTEYGPDEPIPPLPAELHRLALHALDRVAAEDSEINELWEEAGETQAWLDELTRLRQVLAGVS